MGKVRRFVIPDIHGCDRTFRHLVRHRLRIERDDSLYLLGDLIDRGPRSKGVIDEILSLREEGYSVHPVRGNHEDMLLNACRDRSVFRLWMLNGGDKTLASFDIEEACSFPLPYLRFFESLPPFILLDDFVLVHGGLDFTAEDPFDNVDAMLWSRSYEVDKGRIGGRRLVCGHTPQSLEAIRRSLASDRITLDNGCVYAHGDGLGHLTALELDSLTLHVQENIDRE
ncbi:MAG TPA: metallophosphoesterase family protein [Geobacteraceae bacterium]